MTDLNKISHKKSKVKKGFRQPSLREVNGSPGKKLKLTANATPQHLNILDIFLK